MDKNKQRETSQFLNPYQKNSLQIALRLLEEKLYVAQLLVNSGTYQGIMYTLNADLNEQQKEKFQSLIQDIKTVIQKIKEQFNLSNSIENVSQQIQGTAHYFHSVLLDETSEKLKRYGSVANGLEEILDPLIFQITHSLVELNHLLSPEEKTREEQ